MTSIPNSIKEALLQIKLGNAAMVLELIALLGLGFSHSLDFATIQGAAMLQGIAIDESRIRRGLFLLVKYGLASWRPIRLKTRGRPGIEYKIASWENMAKMLGIKLHHQENCDSPGETGFSSLKNYRKGLYLAFIRRAPGKYSRRFLGNRLGVGKRTTWSYDQELGIAVSPNWDNEELSFASIKFAPKTRQNGKFFIQSWDAEFKKQEIFPYTEFIVRRELSRGRRVYKAWQSTNEYSIAA